MCGYRTLACLFLLAAAEVFGQQEEFPSAFISTETASISISTPAAPVPDVLRAKAPPGLGGGFILGTPTGLTLKYWLSDSQALDAAVGLFDSEPSFHADYLIHGWKVFPQSKEARMAAVLGLGVRFEPDDPGIRGVLGASYILNKNPVEIFFELVPVLRLEKSGFDLDGALGVRYYFTAF